MRETTQEETCIRPAGKPLSAPVAKVLATLETQTTASYECKSQKEALKIQTNVLNAFRRLGDGSKRITSRKLWTKADPPKRVIQFTVEPAAEVA